jgi:signal transduction histidine kinase
MTNNPFTKRQDPEASLSTRLSRLLESLRELDPGLLPVEARQSLAALIPVLKDLPEELGLNSEQKRLAALYRVSSALGTTLNLEEVLNQVMDAVISLTGAERGFLMLHDPNANDLVFKAARNFEQETLTDKNAISRSVIEMVVKSGKPVLTTDARTDPRFSHQESVVLHALRAIMCAPLRSRGMVIGVIYVDNRVQSGLFTPEDLDLLNAFAAQAAIAIENARLYAHTDQALSERVAELETLSQIDRQLTDRLDFDHVLDITRDWALKGASAEKCWIALSMEEGQGFSVVCGSPSDYPTASSTDAGALPVNNPPRENTPALMVCPLLHGGKLMGLLTVQREMAFSEAETKFMQRLANRAANAIENTRLYEAVQQANQEKTKFISVVTHELRIPMTAIKGYSDLIRQRMVGPINEQQASFLEIIRNNIDRMSHLVADLSDISRIESGRLTLQLEMLSLEARIQETADSLEPRFSEKDQALKLDLPKKLPMVYADPNRLVQILTNLLSNANKYTPLGGEVRVQALTENGSVRVEVCDTGIGISPQDQEHLFEQFFRSEDNAVREQQGWGLGLNVTKRLVELMNGKIGVYSAKNQGSTFWFSLPVSSGT